MSAQPKLQVRSLELYAADTCNLRCEHCLSPFLTEKNLPDVQSLAQSLAILKPLLRAAELKILGGEPLLNKELPEILKVARASGVFEKIRITTNGILLSRASREIWELADVIEVSSYPSAHATPSEETLIRLYEIAQATGTEFEVWRHTRFQRSTVARRIEDDDIVADTYRNCAEVWSWGNHLLYDRRLYRCSRVHTLDRYLNGLGVDHRPFTELDGLPIDGRPSFAQELHEYLKSTTPLEACRHCLGTSGASEPHRQLSAEEIRAWKGKGDYPAIGDTFQTRGSLTWTHRQAVPLSGDSGIVRNGHDRLND